MASYGLTLVTAPTSEPITLAEAQKQCGVAEGADYHDTVLLGLVKSAREKVEGDTSRALMPQTWDFTFDLWPCGLDPIYLPIAPVSSITSLKYYDTSGVQQTLATTVYHATRFLDREPAEIRLKNAQSWPSLYGEPGAITIRVVCGYANALAVPESLKQAMKLLISAWHSEQALNEERYDSLISRWRMGDEFHGYSRSYEYA
jgi:uncharacterized phiE125 gp8 family phage protein